MNADQPPEPRRCPQCRHELQPGAVYLAADGKLYCSPLCALKARGVLKP